jgi:hypothetical protein
LQLWVLEVSREVHGSGAEIRENVVVIGFVVMG